MSRNRETIFLISACPLSVHLFSSLAPLFPVKGIALFLDGEVCKNLGSFIEAEKGKKKGKTHLFSEGETLLKKLFDRRLSNKSSSY